VQHGVTVDPGVHLAENINAPLPLGRGRERLEDPRNVVWLTDVDHPASGRWPLGLRPYEEPYAVGMLLVRPPPPPPPGVEVRRAASLRVPS
jgi:hypothetical protein